jgi:predicted HicB family RNase H-like nuclease
MKLNDFESQNEEQTPKANNSSLPTIIFNKGGHIMRKKKFSKQLTIAIPPEYFDQIKRITDDQEISLAEFCRDALAEALTKNQLKGAQMNEQQTDRIAVPE